MRKSILLWIFAAAFLIWTSNLIASRVFTGASTHIDVTGSSVNVTGTTLTLSAWVRYTTLPSSPTNPFFIARWDSPGSKLQYVLGALNPTGKFIFAVGNGSGTASTTLSCTSSVSTGIWYHVAATLSGSSQIIYQNGVNCGSNSAGISMGANGLRTCIVGASISGNNCSTVNNYLIGQEAEVAIWNVKLTPNEITALANCTSPPVVHGGTSLVGYWPLWGIDSPEQDYSGNKDSGAVTGATAGNHVCGFLQ